MRSVTSVNKIFLNKSLKFLEYIQVVGSKIVKNKAGDFVRSAKPNINPAIMATSKRFVRAVITANIKVHTPNMVSIESTSAILSKKNAIGQIAQRKLATNASFLFLNNKLVNIKIPSIVPIPEITESNLEINNGSEKRLTININTHMKNGCLPLFISRL